MTKLKEIIYNWWPSLLVAVLCLIALPVLALEAAAPPEAPPTFGEMILKVMLAGMPIVLPALTFLAQIMRKVVPVGIDWLKVHTEIKQNEKANQIKNRLFDIGQMLVLEAMQVSVDGVKRRLAAGSITPEQAKVELAKIKDDVLAKWKEHATAENLWAEAKTILFDGNEAGVVGMLASGVEALIAKYKASASDVPTPGSTRPAAVPVNLATANGTPAVPR